MKFLKNNSDELPIALSQAADKKSVLQSRWSRSLLVCVVYILSYVGLFFDITFAFGFFGYDVFPGGDAGLTVFVSLFMGCNLAMSVAWIVGKRLGRKLAVLVTCMAAICIFGLLWLPFVYNGFEFFEESSEGLATRVQWLFVVPLMVLTLHVIMFFWRRRLRHTLLTVVNLAAALSLSPFLILYFARDYFGLADPFPFLVFQLQWLLLPCLIVAPYLILMVGLIRFHSSNSVDLKA